MKKGKELKPHIAVIGRRNAGKSSLINALAGQEIAIVSNVPGTTTDPVKKSIEIKGIGPVVMIDTAGLDDIGDLGKKRVSKTLKILSEVDLVIFVLTCNDNEDNIREINKIVVEEDVPFFVVCNKKDIYGECSANITRKYNVDAIDFSATNPIEKDLDKIFSLIKRHLPESSYKKKSLLGDIINQGDIVVLVTPIDEEAPEGRLILPQVQTIRDVIDNDAIAVTSKERELDIVLGKLAEPPKIVITDSQVFNKVAATIPENILMTSFSILLARQKGDFEAYIEGTYKISDLKDGDKILLLESCTHQVSCDDIGRVKIPRWMRNFTGKKLDFVVVSGLSDLPNLKDFAMVIQCGGCVVTNRQLQSRIKPAIRANIPVSNYGMTIAYVQGIFPRAIKPFVKGYSASDVYL